MLKSQLIELISRKQNHLTEKDIHLGVNVIIDTIVQALSQGRRVEIRGFGSFSLRYRLARLAHNPKTKEKLTTHPKYVLHFKPGKAMRKRVNAFRHLLINDAETKRVGQ